MLGVYVEGLFHAAVSLRIPRLLPYGKAARVLRATCDRDQRQRNPKGEQSCTRIFQLLDLATCPDGTQCDSPPGQR